MFKYILKIALYVLIFNFNILFSFNKDVCAEDLHIFNVLNNAKLVLMENIAIANSSNKDHIEAKLPIEQKSLEQKSLDLVKMEIELLREIVQGFNEGLLFFVEYRFINVCNFFSNFDSIEPRDLRAFKRKVTKFDNFIQNYSLKKKGVLDKREVELCEKIINFDQILLTCFLRYDFYNIDTVDRIIDTCFFRPAEFMGVHPLFTTSASIIILSILFYYYVYPNLGNFNDSDEEDNSPLRPVDENVALDEKHPTLENKSDSIDVAQIRVFRQNGRMCGANAAFRLIAFHESKGDVLQAYKIANDAVRFNECCRHWAEITKVSSLNDLHTGHLDVIIKDYNASHADSPINGEDLTMVDDSMGLRDSSKANFADFYGIDDSTIVVDDKEVVVDGKRTRLKEGHTQYFIINTAENDIPGFGGDKETDKPGAEKDKKDDAKKVEEKPKETAKPQPEKSWISRFLEAIFGKNETDENSLSKSTDSGKKGSNAKRDKKWKRTNYGHWISLMFVNDSSARDGVRVIMADSIGNPNRTDDPLLKGLHRMLVYGS